MSISLDSRITTWANPETYVLGPGTYEITVDDGAWKAWNNVTCTDPNGCVSPKTGWLNWYSIHIGDFIGDEPVSMSDSITFYNPYRYPTMQDALANAATNEFILDTETSVSFFIKDTNYSDNFGTIALQVAQTIVQYDGGPPVPVANPVPEPTTMVLFGAGLTTLAALRRRNKK